MEVAWPRQGGGCAWEATVERGGMEVAILHFKVGQTGAQAYMYRTPDGKIQELLIARE